MNKKIVIVIIVSLILISCGIGIFIYLEKSNPEEYLAKYVEYLNNNEYEKMYDMITEESKNNITKEEFVERNKKIYQGIDMSDMEISELQIIKETSQDAELKYNTAMNTSVGKINFENSVKMVKDKKQEYLIEWSSNLIFPELNNTDKVRIKTVTAERGTIYDKNGEILAYQGEVSSVGIVPSKLGENREKNIQKVSELLGISEQTINKNLSASWVKEDSFVPIKKVAITETKLKEELLQIPGIKITSAKSRVYPKSEITAQLIGYIQNITAEELEKNKGKGYTENSIIGKTGLEKAYEERLKGKDGKEIYIEDEKGNRKTEIAKVEVQNGEDISLTIDLDIQEKLYNELKENKGLFVVMEPQTGAIEALVSTPSYNPNKFVLGMTDEEWDTIKNDEKKPMLARYLESWCPGSTFKPITGAIGLTTNSLKTTDTFSYNGLSWQKDNSWGNYKVTTLTEYKGEKNLRNALIHSDNIYFAQATLQIGKDNFIKGLKKIKFSENIDFPLAISKSQYSNKEDIETETRTCR